MKYRVCVNDVFGHMDQSRKYTKGEYSTYGEALAVCSEIVDSSLRHECVPGMPASALYFRYMMFGKEPFIVEELESPDTLPGFSALDYARARCEELCARLGEENDQRVTNRPGSVRASN
jgi:hypothetical protein